MERLRPSPVPPPATGRPAARWRGWLGLVSVLALLAAFAGVCLEQQRLADQRLQARRLQDTLFGHCLDQMEHLTIARCRQRFAPRPP